MKKIIILASDTPHRRYFIKKLIADGFCVEAIIFESKSIQASFPVGPFFEMEEKEFEQVNFFKDFDSSLDGVQVKVVETINDQECLDYLDLLKPDFGLVFGTRRINMEVIKRFKEGAINIHRGIAEEYRGLDTNLWAIYHSDFDNVGVTIHYVANELDTGDIVYQERLSYPSNVKVFQLRYYETLFSTELSKKALLSYINGNLRFRKQLKKGRYYSFMPLVIKNLLPSKLENYNSYVKQ